MNDTVGRRNKKNQKFQSVCPFPSQVWWSHLLIRLTWIFSISEAEQAYLFVCLLLFSLFFVFCFCFVLFFFLCLIFVLFLVFALFCFLTKAQSYIDRGRPWTSPLELFFDSLQLSVSFSVQDVGRTVSSFTPQNTPALQATSVASLMRCDIGNNTIMNSLDTLCSATKPCIPCKIQSL